MEERSLRVVRTDKTFFNKITNTISKILVPTRISINGMLIKVKRNALIKAFESYISPEAESDEKDELEKRYDKAYSAYLEALDKYVLDSIYKKVRNNTATDYERQALSQYYGVVQLKESEHIEYKYRKQKYLLELDYQNMKFSNKEKIIDKYIKFYIEKMDTLYKGILKNYSIKLADSTNIYDSSKEFIYAKIFATIEDYIENILSIKMENQELKELTEEYQKYQSFEVGKLDTRDNIEKNMITISISRKLFTHSVPLIVAEQCYKKLLKDARCLIQDTKIANKRERAYTLLMNLIEDYNIKLLNTKVYWDNPKERESFKQFINKYKSIEKLKETDFVEFMKQKEILFIRYDMKDIENETIDYTRLIKYYKRKLVDYGEMKQLNNICTSKGKYTTKSKIMKNKIKV